MLFTKNVRSAAPPLRYDGHTLPQALEQPWQITQSCPKVAICDQGRAPKTWATQKSCGQDARCLAPANAIDPAYGRTLRKALKLGVEALAWLAKVGPQEIVLRRALPVVLPKQRTAGC